MHKAMLEMSGELGDEMGTELREMADQVENDQETYDPGDPSPFGGGPGWDAPDPSSGGMLDD